MSDGTAKKKDPAKWASAYPFTAVEAARNST